ncbi:tyrosine-type recombinase/integrase [Terrisporobacter hibernicus]|uniref:Site-specific integrase n=1 Tax=Terrisporobacter hibernicus TaxID=2813371 RepID=A0AAX2ZJI2_9FIRM|nr:tyrosine-type recombinase/integrase [Terrisporobacter hibernicus]UEL49191.1 site-specific integrase [Terrisporobacter hibernicus]
MSKRANGEGSISKYKNGWRSRLMVGYDNSGKPVRKEFYGKTQKEVKKKLDEYKKLISNGIIPTNDKITLEEWFYTWLWDFRKRDLKEKSFQRYEGIYRNYILNSDIGRVKLTDLNSSHIQRYYNKLLDVDNKPTSTIKSLNTKLKTCLTEAEKQGYIQKNWCKLVTLPKDRNAKEIKVLTKEEQDLFVEAIKGHPLETLFLLALGTGLRLGELLGLKWQDIDFTEKNLKVNRSLQRITEITREGNRHSKIIEQTPKSKNSSRTIPLPDDVIKKLKLHKSLQNESKLLSGSLYSDNDYVFTNEIGYPIDDKKPGRNLKSILKKLNIEPIKFHALRHTYATRLFEVNVSPKIVQMLMGHYDISITMDIYTHVMENQKVEAVEQLNQILKIGS